MLARSLAACYYNPGFTRRLGGLKRWINAQSTIVAATEGHPNETAQLLNS
jgi:hypothetical protein